MAIIYLDYATGLDANDGSTRALAKKTLTGALAIAVAGDTIYAKFDHAETQATAMTLTSAGTAANPVKLVSCNWDAEPPTAYQAGASVTTTVTSAITYAGYLYSVGVTFNVGTGAGASNWSQGNSATSWTIENGAINLLGTNTANINIGSTNPGPFHLKLKNSTVRFGAVSQAISITKGMFEWENTASAVNVAGSIPTTLIKSNANPTNLCIVDIRNVDLSAVPTGKTVLGNLSARVRLQNCKIDNAATLTTTPTDMLGRIELRNVTGSALNYQHSIVDFYGSLAQSSTVKRTNGATDGTTGLSWKLTTTADAKWITPFKAYNIAEWNTSTSTVTATVEGVADPRYFSALPTNAEVWIEGSYFDDASSGQGTPVTSGLANILSAAGNLTASTEAWDTGATARQNSFNYAVGDIIKVASNPGRIFICTADAGSGISNATEPAGYATAVDGGTVVDDGCTFKAAWRFKTAVTLTTPAQAGLVSIVPRMAKASSVVYIDPKVVIA